MTWDFVGERLDTSDFSGSPRVFQSFKLNQDIVLRAVRPWIIGFNSPVFSNLRMKIFSNKGGRPKQQLFVSSNAWNLSDLSEQPYFASEIWFEFDPEPQLIGADTYHLALSADSYTGNDTSHLAWVRGVPDPVNPTNFTLTFGNILSAPFKVSFIGAPL